MVVLGNIVIKGDFERDHRDKLFGTEFGGILGYLEPFYSRIGDVILLF